MAWRSFVALGDSNTAGLDDPYPGNDGYRGWADPGWLVPTAPPERLSWLRARAGQPERPDLAPILE